MTYQDWFSGKRETAYTNFKKSGFTRYMEVKSRLLVEDKCFDREQLLKVAEKSTIHTFGWPIAVFMMNREEYKPKPDGDDRGRGIYAEIAIEGESFDYWAISENARFYLLRSLFEDKRKSGSIFFDTRIIQVTETLLYLRNLYSGLDIGEKSQIEISIEHGGIKGSILDVASSNRLLFEHPKSDQDLARGKPIKTSLSELNSNMVDVVERFIKPLFEMFDFFKMDRRVIEDIVNRYISGEVS